MVCVLIVLCDCAQRALLPETIVTLAFPSPHATAGLCDVRSLRRRMQIVCISLAFMYLVSNVFIPSESYRLKALSPPSILLLAAWVGWVSFVLAPLCCHLINPRRH